MKRIFLQLATVAALVTASGVVQSQSPGAPAQQSGASLATTLNYLVRFGTDAKDPYALLTAARLINRERAFVESIPEGGRATSTASPKMIDPLEILDQAEKFAVGNETLLSEIRKDRNAMGGTRWWGWGSGGGCSTRWRCNAWGYCEWVTVCF